MMKFEIWNCNIWDMISSLSTLAAVIVSLCLANRKKKIRRELHITEQFRENYSIGEICLLVTIENVGNVPVILNNYGGKCSENNVIMKDIQEFLVGKDELIMIRPDEAKVVTYKYNFGKPFQESDPDICNSSQYKLLKRGFKAQDTLGNFYL